MIAVKDTNQNNNQKELPDLDKIVIDVCIKTKNFSLVRDYIEERNKEGVNTEWIINKIKDAGYLNYLTEKKEVYSYFTSDENDPISRFIKTSMLKRVPVIKNPRYNEGAHLNIFYLDGNWNVTHEIKIYGSDTIRDILKDNLSKLVAA